MRVRILSRAEEEIIDTPKESPVSCHFFVRTGERYHAGGYEESGCKKKHSIELHVFSVDARCNSEFSSKQKISEGANNNANSDIRRNL